MRGLRGLGIGGLANPVFGAGCPRGANLMSTILSYDPIAYWPLNELSGTDAINYGSLGTAANGTYSGVTLDQIDAPGGGRTGLFDGVNDRVNIYSAALAAAFSGTLGTAIIFAKVYNIGVWTDGISYKALTLADGASYANRVIIEKTATNNTGKFDYRAASTSEEQTYTSSSVSWVMLGMTWNDAGDQVIYYRDGVQEGAIDTGIATWNAPLGVGTTNIGCLQVSTNHWYGYLSHVAIYTSALTQPQIASINAAGGV